MSIPTDVIRKLEHGRKMSQQGVADALSGFDSEYIKDMLESAIRGREFLKEPINDSFIDALLSLVQPTLWAELQRRMEIEELEEGSY